MNKKKSTHYRRADRGLTPVTLDPVTSALGRLLREDAVSPPALLEAVTAHLDRPQQPPLDEATIDRVLDSYLDDQGRLMPIPVVGTYPGESDLSPADALALARARQLNELRANAWSRNTLLTYGAAVRAWRRWCTHEQVPALPLHPLHVVHHLMDLAFVRDGSGYARDDEGALVTSVVAGTVDVRLTALNKLAEFLGQPRPGDNAGVAEVMRGLRRTLSSELGRRRAALDLRRLDRCLEATTGVAFRDARNRAAVLTRARTGASAGQLVKLTWSDVELSDAEVVVCVPPQRSGGNSRQVVVRRHRNPALCLVRALTSLRRINADLNLVFAHPDGTALTRQAMHLAIDQAAGPLGGFEDLPGVADRDLAGVLAVGVQTGALMQARDRALLLTGFYTARRRSELSALNWRDLIDVGEDGIEVRVRRSKTDQEGRGFTNWLPQAPRDADLACPATALRAYRRALQAALRRDLAPEEPVFVRSPLPVTRRRRLRATFNGCRETA